MQKSQLLEKYRAGSNYGPKTSKGINNNYSDYLIQSKYSKVLQTALHHQNYVAFLSTKRKGIRPPKPPLAGCATASK